MGDPFHEYYYRQSVGGGLPVFRGLQVQRGHGLGNLVNAAFRMILPGIKSAGKAVLRQGVATGANILSDVISGQSLKQAAKRRALESGETLMNRALARAGLVPGPAKKPPRGGRKTAGKRRKAQSGSGRRGGRKRSGVRKRVGGGGLYSSGDIFSA